MHLVVHANELRTGGSAEESENGVQPHLLEKLGLFDSLQQCDLLLARETRDRADPGNISARFACVWASPRL